MKNALKTFVSAAALGATLTLGTVTSALLAAAALAAWGPARRAVRIPPGEALRAE